MRIGVLLAVALVVPAPVLAQASAGNNGSASAGTETAKLRDLCPERPGLDTPACIVDAGHLLAELGTVDWTLDRRGGSRTDTLQFADLLLRYGIGSSTELQVHWDGIGHVRQRDDATGRVTSVTRAGDVSFGLKQSLLNPDGDKLSVAIDPSISAPVGRAPVGAGDWGAVLKLPVTYKLSDKLQLAATPEVDATVDQDGHGRHLAYGSAAGVGYSLSKAITLTGEFAAYRDDDPSGHTTEALASVSLAWQPSDNWQIDAAAVPGLNHNTPDIEVYAGVSRRF